MDSLEKEKKRNNCNSDEFGLHIYTQILYKWINITKHVNAYFLACQNYLQSTMTSIITKTMNETDETT